MKMKLFLFTCLLAASLGLSLSTANNAYAIGESYKWINETTIEGTAGAYGSMNGVVKDGSGGPSRPVPVGTVQFVRDGQTNQFKAPTTGIYYGSTSGQFSVKCNLQLSLTVTKIDTATLSTNSAGNPECTQTGLTKSVTMADSSKAPPADSLGIAAADNGEAGAAENKSSCAIDGVGWILCPAMNFMATIVDGAYAFVASLLVIQPIVSDNGPASESIYGAWSVMRNFANIAFVIAFMFIIFSQLTSIGMNNYGIKKMLPRLVVAAILVNVSFWICAIAVDISNILGASLNGLFQAIPELQKTAQPSNTAFTIDDPIVTGSGWQGIVGAVLVGGALTAFVLHATLAALLPALLAALVAIATVFIVLTMRQALVILLIVISPLAFVAYLLPNTESLFKKWLGLFKTLLLMYPIIAMIFGASALASGIVMQSATGDYKIAIQIMGALISIIPLALTPVVMKTAGGVLNRVGGFVNNPHKGPVDKLRKGAEGIRDRRQAIAGGRRMERGQWALEKTSGLQSRIRGDGSSKLRSRAATALGSTAAGVSSSGATASYGAQQKNEYAKRALTEGQQDYIANRASTDAQFAQSLAGPTGSATKIQATAVATMRNRQQSEIKDASEIIYNLNLDPAEIRKLALGGHATKDGKTVADSTNNLALKNAARQLVVNNGDALGVKALLDSAVGNTDEKDRLGVADAFAASNNRPAYVSQGYMGAIRQGTSKNTESAIEEALINNTYSPDKIAVADKDEINMIARVAKTTTNANVTIQVKQRLINNAHKALTDPELSVKISKNLGDITDLRDHKIPSRVIT